MALLVQIGLPSQALGIIRLGGNTYPHRIRTWAGYKEDQKRHFQPNNQVTSTLPFFDTPKILPTLVSKEDLLPRTKQHLAMVTRLLSFFCWEGLSMKWLSYWH